MNSLTEQELKELEQIQTELYYFMDGELKLSCHSLCERKKVLYDAYFYTNWFHAYAHQLKKPHDYVYLVKKKLFIHI